MSTETAISMRELEAESAELLPSRETLCYGGRSHNSGTSITEFASSNGFINVLSGDNINVNVLGVGF